MPNNTVSQGPNFPAQMDARNVREKNAEIERLKAALQDLYRGYVNLLQVGRNRIVSLGGDCDSVQVMEIGDPVLRRAREILNVD